MNNFEISRFYFINEVIKNMSHDVKNLNSIMALHPNDDHSEEIEEVKARLKECISDISELLEKEDESV